MAAFRNDSRHFYLFDMKIQYQNKNITVFESALYRTTATVIGFSNSVLIVDPNWLPNEVSFIAAFVEEHYKNHQQYLLFTHSDYDHIIGYGKFPNAKVIASEKFTLNLNKDDIINQIINFDNEYYITRDYPISYPVVDIVIKNYGQTFKIDGISLVFYPSPGHVSDGIFVLIPELNCWIAGDYLSNIEIPFVDDNLESYIHTLHLAKELRHLYPDLSLMINGHGDIALSSEEILNRIKKDLEYLDFIKACPANDEDLNRIHDFILTYANNPTLIKAHLTNLEKQNKH